MGIRTNVPIRLASIFIHQKRVASSHFLGTRAQRCLYMFLILHSATFVLFNDALLFTKDDDGDDFIIVMTYPIRERIPFYLVEVIDDFL